MVVEHLDNGNPKDSFQRQNQNGKLYMCALALANSFTSSFCLEMLDRQKQHSRGILLYHAQVSARLIFLSLKLKV